MGAPDKKPTEPLRLDHVRLLTQIHGLGERLEKLHELGTLEQLAVAREVLEFVAKNVAPHARAEEYTLYPAADWAAGEGSRLTEIARYEHQIVSRRCQALEKAISAGAPAGKLMHLCFGVLGLVVAHFWVTDGGLVAYIDIE